LGRSDNSIKNRSNSSVLKRILIDQSTISLKSKILRKYETKKKLNFDSSYSRESFEVFLDLIHNRISYPNVEKAGDVYDICNCLCQLLNDDSSERVISILIQNQDHNDDNIDFSKYKISITQKIETYLENPSFCLVSLPSLCLIFNELI